MIQVDLTNIHKIMIRNYGSRNMQVDTLVESKNFIRPKELKITFDYDPLCNVDLHRLSRRLGRHIQDVKNFYVSVNNNKIEILVVLYYGRKLKDYDFEFSEN
jgi:hypothetical protein